MIAPVVVGVDDIDQSSHAMELAGQEAGLRGAPLWVAHAFHRAPLAPLASVASVASVGGTGNGPAADDGALEASAEPLEGALKRARADYPGLEIRSCAVSGAPAVGLAALAEEASLLVVGHRGRGGFAGMLLGSVALRAVTHARCPVAIARGARRAMNRVLVGVDIGDTSGSAAQLDFAFQEAALRGAELVVMHTWEDSGYFYPDPMGDYTRDHLAAVDADHRKRLDAVLEPWRGRYPGIFVESRVQGGSASHRLVDASAHTDLLVVGGRPHHDGEGMQAGGLALALLHHARCPVVVVPERRTDADPDRAGG